MKKFKRISTILLSLALILTFMPAMSLTAFADDEAAPLPNATITRVSHPRENAKLYDSSALNGGSMDPIDTVALDAEYVFTAEEPSEETLAEYGNWFCDFRMTVDNEIEGDELGLWGSYYNYDVGFYLPENVTSLVNAGQGILMLGSLGMTRTYSEIWSEVGEFQCGVFHQGKNIEGTKIKVDLIIWNEVDGSGNPVNAKTRASKTYTFGTTTSNEMPSTVTVDEAQFADINQTIKNDISDGTTVSGLSLSTENDVKEGETSGVAAAIAEAEKHPSSGNAVVLKDSEALITIEVKVDAELASYKDDENEKSIAFNLNPTAVVTAVKDNAITFQSEPFKVDNDWIDTSSPISVTIYTGFEPAEIIHKDSNGRVIEVFKKDGDKRFVYEDGTCTVKISEFSSLIANKTSTFPTVTVTPVSDLPVSTVYNGQTATDDKVVPQVAYNYVPKDTPESEVYAAYKDWNVDFVVSFNKDVAAGTLGLYGNYANYGNRAYLPTTDLTAGTEYYLISGLGLDDSGLKYRELVDIIKSFDCGAFNLDAANKGTKMTVKLRLYRTDDGGNPIDKYDIDTQEYTFGDPTGMVAYPNATITPGTDKNEVKVYFAQNKKLGTIDVPKYFTFTPDKNSGAGTASYEAYKDWCCDYVVSFDKKVNKDSIALYGEYAEYKQAIGAVGLLLPADLEANTEYYLLESALGDSHFTYDEVVNIVKEFSCGALNLSRENYGTTMTVSLRIFPRDHKEKAVDIATQTYKFDKSGEEDVDGTIGTWDVNGVSYNYVSSGISVGGKNYDINNNVLIDQTEAGPHFAPAGQDITVVVTSLSYQNETDPPVQGTVPVTGGGDYVSGEAVTVGAPNVNGYDFVGWFSGEQANNLVSSSQNYTFRPTADTSLSAVYRANTEETFNLTVTGNKFTIDGTTYSGSRSEQDGVGSVHTLNYTGDDKFQYWTNASGNIVSTSKEYVFTLVYDTVLRAVSVAEATNDSVQIAYLNAFNQVISYGTVSNAAEISDITPNYIPSKMGYEFKKFVIKETGDEATNDNILALKGGSLTYHIVPEYTQIQETYNLKVYKVENSQTELAKEYTNISVGMMQAVNASDLGGSGEFKYWASDAAGEKKLSYSERYTAVYGSSGDKVLYAVFGEAEAKTPTIGITQMFATTTGSKYKISTTFKSFAPEGCTILETGFVYSLNPIEQNDLVIDAPGTRKNLSGLTFAEQTYTMNGTISNPDKTLYIRGFMTYHDASGNHTIYTDMWSGSYKSLTH